LIVIANHLGESIGHGVNHRVDFPVGGETSNKSNR
jgi:hypothetical protein